MPHKKSHKKTAGRKSRRTVKKGGFYGASGAIAPGAMKWETGQETATPPYAKVGGKKRRASRRKTRKVRGGTRFESATAGYVGTGSRGVADYVDVGSTRGASAGGAFNNHGAQPGSGYSSFVKTS